MKILLIIWGVITSVHLQAVFSSTVLLKLKGCGLPTPLSENFFEAGDRCYHFSDKKANWFEARDACARLNVTLANLASEQEINDLVAALGQEKLTSFLYFGANGLYDGRGTFTYISTGLPMKYKTAKYSFNSLVNNNKDCMAFRISSPSHPVYSADGAVPYMEDQNCKTPLNYLCEKTEPSYLFW